MAMHTLKIGEMFYFAVKDGTKKFEVRFNADRRFQAGDILLLQPINRTGAESQTLPVLQRRVTYVLTEFVGLKRGYAVLGMEQTAPDHFYGYPIDNRPVDPA